MPLSQSSLANGIKAQLISQFGAAQDATVLDKYAQAIATAVIAEILSNALVTSTGAVTSGIGAGGTVTATGTIT